MCLPCGAVKISLLGPLELAGEKGPVALGGPRERAVLAVLVLRRGRVATAEALIDAVWGDEPPASAAKNIQTYVSQIRRRLASVGGSEAVQTRGSGYLLEVGDVDVDVVRFERLVQQATQENRAEAAAGLLRAALELWRGDALADVPSTPVLRAEAARLAELRLVAFEEHAEAEIACGRHSAVIGHLGRLLAEHPLRERLWGLLMLALYRAGRQADALAAYRQARAALVDELGVDPGPDLRRLERQILAQDISLDLPTSAQEHGDAPPPFPAPLDGAVPDKLVGRAEQELELGEAWRAAASGASALVLLSGEPGIGKTSLAAAAAREAHTSGAVVLYGRCDPEGIVPYQPFVEALRGYVAWAPNALLRNHLAATAGHLRRLLPELARRFPDEGADLPPATSDRFVLFDAVTSLFESASQHQPVLLVVDDVHWADAATLLLLRHLLRLRDARMLVIATYRDTELGRTHPLAENLALLRREASVRRIAVSGLPRDAVQALADDHGASRLAGAAGLGARIHSETHGNPLFVQEILRHLQETDHVDPAGSIALPEGVREVIGRRLASLSEQTNRVLAVAALVGREFDVGVVAQAADIDDESVVAAVDEAVAAHLLVEVHRHADRYAFPHALVRMTLLDGLTASRRVRLHGRIAAVLESHEAVDPGANVVQLAYHLGEAAQRDDVDRAVEYLRRAAELAMDQLAYEDAEGYYRRALEMLELADDASPVARAELLLALGTATGRTDLAAAQDVLLEAADIARTHAEPRLLARAAIALAGWSAGMSPSGPVVPLLAEAEGLLPEDDPLLADVVSSRAMHLTMLADRETLLQLSRRGIALARATGDPAAIGRAVSARLIVLSQLEDTEERLTLANELLRDATARGDEDLVAMAQRQRIWALLARGAYAAAESAIADHRVVASRTRHPMAVAAAAAYDVMLATARGEFGEAERLIRMCRPLNLRTGDPGSERGMIFVLRWLQGRVTELAGSPAPSEHAVGPFASERAVFAAEAGDLSAARAVLETLAPHGYEAWQGNLMSAPMLFHAAVAIPLIGDPEAAAALYRVLERHADRDLTVTGRLHLGAVAFHLGRLATTMGDHAAARRHLEVAEARYRDFGALAWVERTEAALRQLPSATAG